MSKTETLAELDSLALETREPNWDGYNADGVMAETVALVREIIRLMPDDLALPSLSAEPDGHVSMEWIEGQHQRLSVSISPNGSLAYAAILDGEARHGTTALIGEIPEIVLRLIRILTPPAERNAKGMG
jgi:hypothetical protein